MARNWGAIIVREMEKAENQRRREALRIEKEQQRERIKVQNIRLREQAKADKEHYVASQILQAEKMTSNLLRSYEKYNTLVATQISTTDIFSFELLKKKYNESQFNFFEKKPTPKSPIIEIANTAPVPNESWLENIFSSKKEKRLSIISQNKKLLEDIKAINQHNAELAEIEYQNHVSDYEIRKNEAKIEWEKREKQKKETVEIHNAEIDLWHTAYISGDDEAITAYIDTLFSTYNYALDTIIEHQIGYNKHCKKLVVDLHLADKDEIFEAEGYKYMKQRDEFDPIKMKATALTERMRNLMVEICIATFHLLFRNDVAGHLDTITVNVFYDLVCCTSAEVERDTFTKHNFTTRSGISAFLELQMRVFKQINRGVRPFETLFATLE